MTYSKFMDIAKNIGFSTISEPANGIFSLELVKKLLNLGGIIFLTVDGKQHLVSSNILFLQKLDKLRIQKNKNKVVKMLHTSLFEKMFRNNSKVKVWDLVENKKLVIDEKSRISVSPIWIDLSKLNENSFKVLSILVSDIISNGKRP